MAFKQSLYACFFIISTLLVGCKHDPTEPPSDLGGGSSGNGDTTSTGPGPDTTMTQVICDPDTVYFSQNILPLIMSSCAISGCHSADAAEDGVVLNNYANIINTADVEPFDLDGSDLYEVITEDDPDDVMPPPGEYPPLTPDEIQLIATWIMQGAPNNSCVVSGCDTSNVTYTSRIENIVSLKCSGCHSGGSPQGNLSLTNYMEVSNEALFGNMLEAVEHIGNVTPMPYQSDQLPQCEIDLIRIWIENGAPE